MPRVNYRHFGRLRGTRVYWGILLGVTGASRSCSPIACPRHPGGLTLVVRGAGPKPPMPWWSAGPP